MVCEVELVGAALVDGMQLLLSADRDTAQAGDGSGFLKATRLRRGFGSAGCRRLTLQAYHDAMSE